MLVLCRKIIANLLEETIEKRSNMKVFTEYDYKNIRTIVSVRDPNIVLMEIPERHGTPAQDTLSICEEIKSVSPGCRATTRRVRTI